MPVHEGPVGPFPPGQDPDEYDRTAPPRPVDDAEWSLCRREHRPRRAPERHDAELGHPGVVRPEGARGRDRDIGAYTHELVAASRVFCLNIIDREDRAIVRKFTKPVEVDLGARTLNGFAYREGATGAPILDQAVAFLDCEVHDSVAVGGHTLFLGEIVDAGFQKPEDTPILRMEDTRMNYGG